MKNFTQIATFFTKNFWRANLPLVALTAALTLLFLIVEDIYSWTQGKKSIFGEILENERVKKVIADIQNAFAWIKDLINNFSFDKLFDGLLSFAKGLKDAFGDTFAWMWETLKAIGSNIGAIIINPIIDGINDILAKLPKKFTDFLGFENGLQLPRYEMKELPNFFEVIDRRATERANNQNNSTINQNNTVNVTVASSGDSLQDITKAVEKGFDSNYISPALLLNNAR